MNSLIKGILLLWGLSWTINLLPAQSKVVDSLIEEAYAYIDQNKLDTAIYIGDKAIEFAEKNNNVEHQAEALYLVALAYDYKGHTNDAIQNYQKAKHSYEKMNNHAMVATCITGIGIVHYFAGEYDSALENYLEAIEFCEMHSLYEEKSNALINLGIIYRINEDYDQAINIYEQNIPISRQLGDSLVLGKLYNNLGVAYTFKEDYDQAVKYLDSSLALFHILKDTVQHGIIQVSLGDVYLNQKEYAKAENYLKNSYKTLREQNEISHTSKACLFLGELYLKQNKYNQAIQWLREGIITLADSELDDIRLDFYQGLAQAYEKFGNIDSAYHFQRVYQSLNDSLHTLEKINAIEEMQAKFKSEQKQQQINLLNTQNQLTALELKASKRNNYLLVIGILLLLSISGILFFLFKKIKNQNKIIQKNLAEKNRFLEQLQLAQDQIIRSEKMASIGQLSAGIAHEINNPLNYIQNNANALAKDLEDLEELFAASLNLKSHDANAIQAIVKKIELPVLKEEMKQLVDSIQNGAKQTGQITKSLRFLTYMDQDKKSELDMQQAVKAAIDIVSRNYPDIEFQINHDIKEKIQAYAGQINQLLINLLINAAQAIEGTAVKGLININLNRDNDELVLTIKDNGSGIPDDIRNRIFEPFFTTKNVGKGTGLGLSICYSIIENHGGVIEIHSKEDMGSTVVVKLPMGR